MRGTAAAVETPATINAPVATLEAVATAPAETPPMIFGLVETAKANGVNVYEYLKYLLTEIPKHMREKDLSFVEDLLPWAPTIQKNCKL